MPSLGQQFRNGYHITDPVLGWDLDLPSFTCAHCQHIAAPGLSRFMVLRATQDQCSAAVAGWVKSVAVCRSCDAFICRTCAAVRVDGECYAIMADVKRAFEDKWKQPWMLRELGEPVYRILDKDGVPILVPQRQVGYTDREMERLAGQLNYDGSAKWIAGEQVFA